MAVVGIISRQNWSRIRAEHFPHMRIIYSAFGKIGLGWLVQGVLARPRHGVETIQVYTYIFISLLKQLRNSEVFLNSQPSQAPS